MQLNICLCPILHPQPTTARRDTSRDPNSPAGGLPPPQWPGTTPDSRVRPMTPGQISPSSITQVELTFVNATRDPLSHWIGECMGTTESADTNLKIIWSTCSPDYELIHELCLCPILHQKSLNMNSCVNELTFMSEIRLKCLEPSRHVNYILKVQLAMSIITSISAEGHTVNLWYWFITNSLFSWRFSFNYPNNWQRCYRRICLWTYSSPLSDNCQDSDDTQTTPDSRVRSRQGKNHRHPSRTDLCQRNQGSPLTLDRWVHGNYWICRYIICIFEINHE